MLAGRENSKNIRKMAGQTRHLPPDRACSGNWGRRRSAAAESKQTSMAARVVAR